MQGKPNNFDDYPIIAEGYDEEEDTIFVLVYGREHWRTPWTY